jgi:hypothetical protein
MLRGAAALLATLALAGCIDDDAELVIDNVGSEPVLVHVEADAAWGHDEDDHFQVPAGERRVVSYDSPDEVEVRIRRASDGLTLFAASFDREDFEDDHGDIEIVVAP